MKFFKSLVCCVFIVANALYPINHAFSQVTPGSTIQGVDYTGSSTIILPNTAYCELGSDQHPNQYCADDTPCKTINGEQVCLAGTTGQPASTFILSKNCWTWAKDFTCLQRVNNCSSFESDASCKLVSSECISTTNHPNVPGGCLSKRNRYQCTTAGDTTTPSTSTCTSTGEMNGLDWSTQSPSAASDFLKATMAQEVTRQAATYGKDGGDAFKGLFAGTPMGCREGYFGLKNCCKGAAGAPSNNDVAKSIGTTIAFGALKSGAAYAANAGSKYVFDMIASNAAQCSAGAYAMFAPTSFSTGFGAFGFGTTASSAASALGSLSASLEAASVQLGSSGVWFNPYAFAFAIGIEIVMAVVSCNIEEKQLAQARSENLCVEIGTYCSTKINLLIGKVCVEDTTKFCCYNGLLAKGIETAAHQLLPVSWGSAESPTCGGGQQPSPHGLTIEQFASLDFDSQIMKDALKPFEDEILNKYNSDTKPYIESGGFKADGQNTTTDRSKSLCLQRKAAVPSTVCD
jgi:conjugal transfer mating pair stabilization protein TraN